MTESPKDDPSPLFHDSLDGGRGRKTLQVAQSVNGFLMVEMTLVVGRDTLGLSHPIHRTVVADLCKTLSVWLESPESEMRGGEEPELYIPRHDVSDLRLPGDDGPEPTCSICFNHQSQCTCRQNGYR